MTDPVLKFKKDDVVAERRAFPARLSALLCTGVWTLALAAGASAAEPQPPATPKLLTTSPASSATAPAQTTTPSILGEAEPEGGIIIERAPGPFGSPSFAASRSAAHPTANPAFEIQIFLGAGCTGAPATAGSAEALEGAGIPVTAAANSETVFSARQVDPARPTEPSGCSNPLSYWEGTLPQDESGSGESPGGGSSGGGTGNGGSTGGGSIGEATPVTPVKPGAPRIHTDPSGRAKDMTPTVVGSAPHADTVLLYTSPDCGGAPAAKVTPAQFAAGLPVAVAPNVATEFSAEGVSGAQHSPCSEPVTYFEDSTAPRTRITMGPGVKTRKPAVTFRFMDMTADPPGTSFICRVDKAKWKACKSPFRARHLKPGKHKVAILATDLAGNVERKPVTRRFVVVRHSRR